MVFCLYEQQINFLKEKVRKLSKKAMLKKIPTINTSSKVIRAKASFFGKSITFGTRLLEQWKNGEIDESEVEVTLAHEIGHLMDFQRKFRSVCFRYTAILLLYVFFILPFVVWFIFSPNPLPLFVFMIWIFILIGILRKAALAPQLEADKNGASLITYEKFAQSLSRRKPLQHTNGFWLIETWKLLCNVLLFPSISERLKNLNFEIKEINREIEKIESSSNPLKY